MPELAWRASCRGIAPTSWWAASFAIAYGLLGLAGVSSLWGLSRASPKIAPDDGTNTRIAESASRTAARTAAVAAAIPAVAPAGSSQDAGTNEGAARW